MQCTLRCLKCSREDVSIISDLRKLISHVVKGKNSWRHAFNFEVGVENFLLWPLVRYMNLLRICVSACTILSLCLFFTFCDLFEHKSFYEIWGSWRMKRIIKCASQCPLFDFFSTPWSCFPGDGPSSIQHWHNKVWVWNTFEISGIVLWLIMLFEVYQTKVHVLLALAMFLVMCSPHLSC